MKKIKTWLRKNIAAISIAVSNIEKNVFSQTKDFIESNFNHERRNTQSTLCDSLVHGEITQEVKNLRWRTYKILKSSNNNSVTIKGYDENGYPIYTINKTNNKKLLKKIKLDTLDSYELEMVFTNDKIPNGVFELMAEINDKNNLDLIEYLIKNKPEKPLNIDRNEYPKFFIENYTKKINIRTIDETEKLLEFYIDKYPDEYNKNNNLFLKEIEKIIKNKNFKSNSLEFDGVSFITNNTIGSEDFLFYEYKILSFDKIIEFDGNYVIKFKSKIIKNGEDVLVKYIENELEEKYQKKERKS
jgi:hypothetical protein